MTEDLVWYGEPAEMGDDDALKDSSMVFGGVGGIGREITIVTPGPAPYCKIYK